MPIPQDLKKGVIGNANVMLITCKGILDDIMQKTLTTAEVNKALAGALACIGITLASLTQALVANMDENILTLVRPSQN